MVSYRYFIKVIEKIIMYLYFGLTFQNPFSRVIKIFTKINSNWVTGNWVKNNLPLEKILQPLRIFLFHFILKFSSQEFSDFVCNQIYFFVECFFEFLETPV